MQYQTKKTGMYSVNIQDTKKVLALASNNGCTYIVHAMLGRKQYLDQYNATPVERHEFARKILRAVSLYADK